MFDTLFTIVSFVVVLGVLIAVHEYGHFIVARLAGVKVLRFSIGFGKPLWTKTGKVDNTEYVIAAVPLGGYVKMLDEREGAVAEAELDRAFNNKPISRRIAIVLAGPVFNFIFAIFAYWLMYIAGVSGLKPVIGAIEQDSMAMQAGLVVGDEIINVADKKTPTWSSVVEVFVAKIHDRVVGCVGAIIDVRLATGISGEIVSLVVSEPHRGNGIGRGLVEVAESWLTQRVVKIRVRANSIRSEAHAFYLKMGYQESKTQKIFEKYV